MATDPKGAVQVGTAFIAMADPHPGFERAYNRWYERDHFYAGCVAGPWMFAGSRWVAPRWLKDLRWPADDDSVATADAGSYVGLYWVEAGHREDHFAGWSPENGRRLYAGGRGFAERRLVHTAVVDHVGTVYRDADPVPVALALDHAYPAIVMVWFDAAEGTTPAQLQAELGRELLPGLLAGSTIEIASSWAPSTPEADLPPGSEPPARPLGTGPGGAQRLVQVLFVDGDVIALLPSVRAYTDAVQAAGLATTRLVSPFVRTVVGTDTYVDELWQGTP